MRMEMVKIEYMPVTYLKKQKLKRKENDFVVMLNEI